MPHPDVLHPEPLPLQQATADPCLHRRLSNTKRRVWLSLCGAPGAHKVLFQPSQCLWWVSGLISNAISPLPTISLGLLPCPWTWDIFFWWDPCPTVATLPSPGEQGDLLSSVSFQRFLHRYKHSHMHFNIKNGSLTSVLHHVFPER